MQKQGNCLEKTSQPSTYNTIKSQSADADFSFIITGFIIIF